MKYELRRMRKLSPGLTVNNSGGVGKGSVILMGEEAWKPAGSAGFPEEFSPVAGREGLGAFCFFSPFDDRTFPGNGYIIRNVCDDAALFFPRNHEHQPIIELPRRPHRLGGLSAYSGLLPRCPSPLL